VVRIRKLSRLGQHELNTRALTDGVEDGALGERILLRHCLVEPAAPDEAAVEALQAALDPPVAKALVDGVMAFSGLSGAEVAAADAAFQAPDAR
jgi:hypothetical protein